MSPSKDRKSLVLVRFISQSSVPAKKDNMRKYRGQRPFVNGTRCQEDCSKCPHFVECFSCTNKWDVSLDQLYKDGEYEPLASTDIEEDAMVNITIKSMYNELRDEDKRCINVFTLLIKETTQREIASELGISQTAVRWYIKRIRKKLEKFR
jgi:RNA polymerase sigma factor (sigma-70 family)